MEVAVQAGRVSLEGSLTLPAGVRGLVIFAHGSGSSRFSSRNRAVAQWLNDAGLGTLLFDLLTAEEHSIDEYSREYRFDISRLSQRLADTVGWADQHGETRGLPIGLFGASTGAAAALVAAAVRPELVAAVVSRGGRPDLAGEHLPRVEAPTLLIVGGNDFGVIELNENAAAMLRCEHRIDIVPGATHLFEEPGTIEEVCRLAADWFQTYLK